MIKNPSGTFTKRRRSYNDPGHAHELTFSCCRGLALLSKDRTRQWLVAALDHTRRKLDLELWAYVIMPEHVHVLLLPRPDRYEVSAFLKAIKQPVAQRAVRFLKANSPPWLEHLRVTRAGGRVKHCFHELSPHSPLGNCCHLECSFLIHSRLLGRCIRLQVFLECCLSSRLSMLKAPR